jgi:pyrroline-5-carboxylate reductase
MARLNKKIGFIGAGNMAEAMITGLLQSGVSKSEDLVASDVSPNRCKYMAERYGIGIPGNNVAVFNRCALIILAVKPQHMNEMLEELTRDSNYVVTERKIVVSIAAGVPLQRIERYLYASIDDKERAQLPIVRVMPNTPALVRAGIAGMAGNRYAQKEDLKTVRAVLEAIGKVIEFDETDLDAVTALSGSGPAYLFYFVESLVAAGESLGLTESNSLTLTLETIKGAVKLIDETGKSAPLLRKKVTSPGGTTEAAFEVLEGHGVKEIIIKALQAATNRSRELSI